MMILRAILIAIEVITSVLLIAIILVQKAKGGGLGLAFGGGATDSLFGSRAGNVLTKGTVILAVIFMVNTVFLAIIYARDHDRTLMDAHMRPTAQPTAQPQPAATPMPPQQASPAATETGFDAGAPTPTGPVTGEGMPLRAGEPLPPAIDEAPAIEVEMPTIEMEAPLATPAEIEVPAAPRRDEE